MSIRIESPKTIGVVVSTYNNPAWLEIVLWGYECQSVRDFEIIIADDGSTEATLHLIKQFQDHSSLKIKHVWQEDRGFRKNRILNAAIQAADSEYLIFTDQDCIPRRDFIETHVRHAEKGYFLSAGYFKLPLSISQELTRENILNQSAFDLAWLKNKGLSYSFKCTKLVRNPLYTKLMNFITPAKATWNGCNSSGWKTDFLAINGFNEKMEYGGEDREFGERLHNYGIQSKQIRYSAICIHLDHQRPYKSVDTMQKNKDIRKQIRKERQIKTPNGIQNQSPRPE
jgi:glycosyltransferase involved in cell wall biosynthesis